MAHITGGSFIENIPRMLPEGCGAAIRLGSWEMPPVFPMLTRLGSLDTRSAYNTFNMGIGMVLAVPAGEAEARGRRGAGAGAAGLCDRRGC